MKVVILCGGLGTRLSEETITKPKPMVEIGDHPMIWHIMKIYSKYGFKDFILALGYKGYILKNYFANYHLNFTNVDVSLKTGKINYSDQGPEDWNVSLIDTGLETMTGGRLLRLQKYLNNHDTFMLTYGDGLGNIDIASLLDFHFSHGRIATVTAVRPPVRFGELKMLGSKVNKFSEKPQASAGWINGGFFVFQSSIFKFINNDATMLEREPLEALANKGELMAYHHKNFWQCMDTLRDKKMLNKLWASKLVPWLS